MGISVARLDETRKGIAVKLQALLGQRGVRARVQNAGIADDTTTGNLAADGIHFNEAGHQNVAEHPVYSADSALQ